MSMKEANLKRGDKKVTHGKNITTMPKNLVKLSYSGHNLKKFLNPFCFACTLGLLPCQMSTAKWQNIAGSKNFFIRDNYLPNIVTGNFFLLQKRKGKVTDHLQVGAQVI